MGICRKSTCSDSVTASEDADTSGYGVHQVIAKEDAREPMGAEDQQHSHPSLGPLLGRVHDLYESPGHRRGP